MSEQRALSDGAPEGRSDDRRRKPGWRRIVTVGVVLPMVAASILIWSASGRQANVDKIPVAIVNNDKIITGSQPMAAGRSLTAALTHPKSPKKNLKWTLTDQQDATTGLRDGTYYAVLTIPKDFSSSILSSGTDKPQRGRLQLVSNGAASSTVPYISQQVASTAATSLGTQTTQGYLTNVYSGFNQLAKSNSTAASNAADLAGGTQQVSKGADQLQQGAGSLAKSLEKLSGGAASLADATASLSSGAASVHSGASGVADGARRLDDGATALAGGAHHLARGNRALATHARSLAAGARHVSGAVHRVTRGSRGIALEIGLISRACVPGGGSVPLCRALQRAARHAVLLAHAAGRVDNAAASLSRGSRKLARGAGAVAGGSDTLAQQSSTLAGGSGELSSSASQLDSGGASLARGAATVDSSAAQLAAGASSASQAGGSLASGSRSLASSAGQVDSGAQSLSSGLAKGAKQSPTYSSSQQKALLPVVSQPTELTSQVQHTGYGNGWLIALIIAVVLWLSGLLAALGADVAVIGRHATAPVGSGRLALSQAVPVVGLGVLQAAVVTVATMLFHGGTAAVVPLALLTLLAAVTFSVLALAFRLALGSRLGVTLFVLLLVLQLAASSNVIPLETAPGVLQRLNALLPLTVFVNGASQLVSGGHVASLVAVAVVLALWAAVACAALMVAVRRHRLSRSFGPAAVGVAT